MCIRDRGNSGGNASSGNAGAGGGKAGTGQSNRSLAGSGGGGGSGESWYDGTTYASGGHANHYGTNGAANTGIGGNARGDAGYGSGGNGGSGVVIIRYSGSQRGSGGTVTSSGGYTYHKFTSSGTYTA